MVPGRGLGPHGGDLAQRGPVDEVARSVQLHGVVVADGSGQHPVAARLVPEDLGVGDVRAEHGTVGVGGPCLAVVGAGGHEQPLACAGCVHGDQRWLIRRAEAGGVVGVDHDRAGQYGPVVGAGDGDRLIGPGDEVGTGGVRPIRRIGSSVRGCAVLVKGVVGAVLVDQPVGHTGPTVGRCEVVDGEPPLRIGQRCGGRSCGTADEAGCCRWRGCCRCGGTDRGSGCGGTACGHQEEGRKCKRAKGTRRPEHECVIRFRSACRSLIDRPSWARSVLGVGRRDRAWAVSVSNFIGPPSPERAVSVMFSSLNVSDQPGRQTGVRSRTAYW